MCFGYLTGSTCVFRAGGEEKSVVVLVMQYGRIFQISGDVYLQLHRVS